VLRISPAAWSVFLARTPTRSVIESKRLPELVSSQLRYIAEPRTWRRMKLGTGPASGTFVPSTETRARVLKISRTWPWKEAVTLLLQDSVLTVEVSDAGAGLALFAGPRLLLSVLLY
jgi:hypothetical protein